MKKRIVSLLMALALCLSLLPTAAFATENEPVEEPAAQEQIEQAEPAPAEPEEGAPVEDAEEEKIPEEPEEQEEPVQDAPVAAVQTMENGIAVQAGGHSHYLCGGDTCTKVGHSKETGTTKFTAWSSTTELPSEAGKYYLTENVEISTPWQPQNDIVLCLNGHTITAQDSGAAINVSAANKSLTLTDCEPEGEVGKVTHIDNKTGSGVYVAENSTFTLYGGSITGNEASYQGGGVCVNGGRFKMFGGSITGNKASGRGGGVCVNGGNSSFTMTGGSITGNNADIGSGIYVNSGNFEMSGSASITGNSSKSSGGGVYVDSDSSFTMTGGSITGNNCSGTGGGVYVYSGTFNMSGGSITGNNATAIGGGVYVGSNGTFTMSDGTIGGTGTDGANTAGYQGGGVYVNNGTFTMSDGSITGNSSKSSGGGVYLYSGSFTVSGKVNITGNTKSGANNNVYLLENNTITIGGALTDGAQLGVTLSSSYGDNVFTSGWNTYMSDKTPSDYFVSDTGTGETVLDNGELKLRNAHSDHYLCGGTTCTEAGHDKESQVTKFAKPIYWDGTNLRVNGEVVSKSGDYYTLPAGNYYLSSDLTLDGIIQISGDVTLCLNSHTITGAIDANVITVNDGVTFTLTDCKDTGKITHASGNTGRGVYVNGDSTFNMYAGSITGSTAGSSSSSGGGVYVKGGTFHMYGGSITNNKAGSLGVGGGVYVTGNGTFHMSSGSITGNTANVGGGVYVDGGSLKMSGGTISSNTANVGGGVYVYSRCTFEMSSGTISSNTATSGNGGGVYVEGGTFTMSGGSIGGMNANEANTAATNGGGVCVSEKGSFEMSGSACITNNKAATYGGGVHISYASATFTMKGGSITGNKVYKSNSKSTFGGGVCVGNGTFTMTDGSITGNNAIYGGGVYTANKFNMSGGSITGNNADSNGGGVYVMYSDSFTVSGEVTVTDNTKGGTKGADGKFTGGTNNNVYLPEGKTITVGTGGLTTGASIGVTTATKPAKDSPVQIATNATGDVDYTKIFTPDAGTMYTITKDGTSVYLALHVHTWTYALKEGTTDTITATCKNCEDNNGQDFVGGSVTVNAPAELTYDGSAKAATVTKNNWQGGDVTVTYRPSTPKDAGTYTASITVGGVTASVGYTIEKADPQASDFSFTAPSALTYDGTEKIATVNVKNGITGMGDIAVKYYKGDSLLSAAPADAGEYTVKIDVAEGTNYNAASDLTADGWKFSIAKATYTGTKEASVNAIINPKGTDVYVTLPELPEGASYGAVTMDENSKNEAGEIKANIFASGAGTIANGKLHLRVQSGTAGLTAHVRVAVTGAKNYQDYEIDITVTTIDKIIATVNVKAPSGVSCGDTITLTPSVTGDGGTNGTWSWTYDRESFQFVQSNANTGVLKIKAIKAGEATITFTYTSDTHEGSKEVTFTVGKKMLTKDDLTGIPDKLTKVYDGTNKHTETVTLGLTNSAKINENEQAQINISKGDITYAQSNAGDTTATLSLKNVNLGPNYGFSVESSITVNAEITKATPSVTGSGTATGTYGQKLSEVEVKGLTAMLNGKTVEGSWALKGAENETLTDVTGSGSAAEYTAVFTPKDTANLTTAEATVAVTVNPKAGGSLGTVNLTQKYTDETEKTYQPDWSKLPADETWTYSGSVSKSNNSITVSKDDFNADGKKLTYQISDGQVNDTVTFTLTATCASNHYEPFTITVVVKLTARDNQPNFKFAETTKTVTYGDADFTVTATGQESGSTVTYASSNENVATVGNDGKVHIVGAGTATITAKAGVTADYNEATASYTLTVNKRTITVTADNKTMTVNGKLPEFTVSYGNLPAGVKAEDIFGTLPTASTTADGKTDGEFDIAVTKGSLKDASKDNYTVEIVNGKLTVTKQSGGYYYYTPTAGGTTDANKSPRTGDAGLLVYGLTALSGYTGTALVLRRKRED